MIGLGLGIRLLTMTAPAAFALMPISTDSVQLQQLVNTSKQQLKTAREQLQYGKRDADYLEKSSRNLEQLSAGIDRSIEKYQGTAVFEKALLKLQSEGLDHQGSDKTSSENEKSKQHFESFQSESVKANLSDLTDQQKLAEALRSAEQGFIPKIQTQTQLGNWQASTRVSSQLTELLTAIHSLSADVRANNLNSGGLAELMQGAEIQNQKQQRGVTNRGL